MLAWLRNIWVCIQRFFSWFSGFCATLLRAITNFTFWIAKHTWCILVFAFGCGAMIFNTLVSILRWFFDTFASIGTVSVSSGTEVVQVVTTSSVFEDVLAFCNYFFPLAEVAGCLFFWVTICLTSFFILRLVSYIRGVVIG